MSGTFRDQYFAGEAQILRSVFMPWLNAVDGWDIEKYSFHVDLDEAGGRFSMRVSIWSPNRLREQREVDLAQLKLNSLSLKKPIIYAPPKKSWAFINWDSGAWNRDYGQWVAFLEPRHSYWGAL